MTEELDQPRYYQDPEWKKRMRDHLIAVRPLLNPVVQEKINRRLQEILQLTDIQGSIEPVEVCWKLGVSPTAARAYLARLIETGNMEQVGKGVRRKYVLI